MNITDMNRLLQQFTEELSEAVEADLEEATDGLALAVDLNDLIERVEGMEREFERRFDALEDRIS